MSKVMQHSGPLQVGKRSRSWSWGEPDRNYAQTGGSGGEMQRLLRTECKILEYSLKVLEENCKNKHKIWVLPSTQCYTTSPRALFPQMMRWEGREAAELFQMHSHTPCFPRDTSLRLSKPPLTKEAYVHPAKLMEYNSHPSKVRAQCQTPVFRTYQL